MVNTALNDQKSRGRPRQLEDEDLLALLRARGGTAWFADIARAVTASEATVRRRLGEMVKSGVLSRPSRGTYMLADQAGPLMSTTYEIVTVLRDSGTEAHLTGYDVLAAHGHQFMRQWPHLVYADPAAIDDLSHALSRAGFVPLQAQDASVAQRLPELDRVVVIRGQSPLRMDRFSAYGHVAPIEKAWIDLLREVSLGWFPLSMADVGSILGSMLRDGIDEKRMHSWAHEAGYGHYLEQRGVGPARDPAVDQLRAGMQR